MQVFRPKIALNPQITDQGRGTRRSSIHTIARIRIQACRPDIIRRRCQANCVNFKTEINRVLEHHFCIIVAVRCQTTCGTEGFVTTFSLETISKVEVDNQITIIIDALVINSQATAIRIDTTSDVSKLSISVTFIYE